MSNVRKKSRKDEIVDEITKGVLSGKYQVGKKLPSERILASEFGVSRSVIRNAIVQLTANKVIESRERSGNIVLDYKVDGRPAFITAILDSGGEMNDELLHDYLQGRLLLEPEIASLAAQNRSEADLKCMYETLQKLTEIEDDDLSSIAYQCFLEHRQIAIACGNTLYSSIINSMEETICILMQRYYCTAYTRSEIFHAESRLYDAIEKHDSDLARILMTEICLHNKH